MFYNTTNRHYLSTSKITKQPSSFRVHVNLKLQAEGCFCKTSWENFWKGMQYETRGIHRKILPPHNSFRIMVQTFISFLDNPFHRCGFLNFNRLIHNCSRHFTSIYTIPVFPINPHLMV